MNIKIIGKYQICFFFCFILVKATFRINVLPDQGESYISFLAEVK